MSDLGPWLLGIGGYAGLAASLVFFNLYPNTCITALPLIVISPVLGATILYGFFTLLTLWLKFTIMVFQSMLNNHLIVLLITSLFIVGQIALIGIILYKDLTRKREQVQAVTEEEAESEEETEEIEEIEEAVQTTAPTDEDEEEEEDEDKDEDEEEDDEKSTDSMPGLITLADMAELNIRIESLRAESPKAESLRAESPKAENLRAESPKAESLRAEGLSPLPVVPELLEPVVPAQNVMPTEAPVEELTI